MFIASAFNRIYCTMKENVIAMNIGMKQKDGSIIKGLVMISDGIAISTFDDRQFTKKLFDLNKNPNCIYNRFNNAFIEKFPNKDKFEIKAIIEKQIEKHRQ